MSGRGLLAIVKGNCLIGIGIGIGDYDECERGVLEMKISELSEEFQLINDSHEIAEIHDFLRLDMNDCDF